MSIFALVAIAAVFATVFALASGISSMTCNDEVGGLNSGQWMLRRVLFQVTAVLFVLLSIYVTASPD